MVLESLIKVLAVVFWSNVMMMHSVRRRVRQAAAKHEHNIDEYDKK